MTSFAQRIRPDNDDERCFGVEPSHANNLAMFELRCRDGDIHMLEYSQLTKLYLRASDSSIIILMIDEVYTVKGRNLKELLPYFKTHRLSYIQEEYSDIDDEEMTIFVDSIEVKQKYPENGT